MFKQTCTIIKKYIRVNLVNSLISEGKAAMGAGGCWNILLNAHKHASANLVPVGTTLNNSTSTIVDPCSTKDVTLSGVPFANEPVFKIKKYTVI